MSHSQTRTQRRTSRTHHTPKPDTTPHPTIAPEVLQRAITDPDTLSPQAVQILQASHGNHYVSNLIRQGADAAAQADRPSPDRQQPGAPVVQRLSMSEKPIDTGTLVSLKNISGAGTGGKTGLIQNEGGEKLVVKVVSPRMNPEGAVAASRIMKQSGVYTPDIRLATSGDTEDIFHGLQTLSIDHPEYEEVVDLFTDRMVSKGWPVLLMDFVEGGQTLGQMDNSGTLVDALNDPTFQKELGMILATDAFYGEGDRMHLKMPDLIDAGWSLEYNPGNLMIIKGVDGFHAIPIDNDFEPKLGKTGKPFARGAKDSSLTVASCIDDFMKEAQAIYDAFVKLEKKPTGLFALFGPMQAWKKKKKQFEANRASFVDTVVQSGRETLDRLLKHGQDWSQQLEEAGVGDQIKDFRVRIRFMRLLRAGVEKNQAIVLARNQTEYRRWRLINELGFTKKQAAQVLELGDMAYKRSVEETIKQGKPVIVQAFDLRNKK